MNGIYWGDAPLVKKYALEGIVNMSRDAMLQTLLVGAGNVWQLVRSLLMYDPSLEEVNIDNDEQINQQMSQAASNTHALLACKALGMLAGLMKNDLVTPENPVLTTALKKMITKPLAKLLRNKRAFDLLRVLNTNVETPTRIWNIHMRNELLAFLDKMEDGRDEKGCLTMAEELAGCDNVVYNNLKNEIVIGDVYVRVFIGLGGGRDGVREIEDCGAFCAALLRFTELSLQKSGGTAATATVGEAAQQEEDIGEEKNLAKEQPDLVKKLSEKLTAHLTEVGAIIPKPDPRFDAAKKVQQLKYLHSTTKAKLEKQHANFLKPDYQPNKTWWGALKTAD